MSKSTILLDVDGVIADCATAVRLCATEIFRREMPPISKWNTFEFETSLRLSPTETVEFYDRIVRDDALPYMISFYRGAREAILDLAKDYDVCFVTAEWKGMKSWVYCREKLLSPLGLDIIYTHSKHRIYGDYLVDDKPENLFSHSARSILVTRPWNTASVLPRVDSISDVRRFIENG